MKYLLVVPDAIHGWNVIGNPVDAPDKRTAELARPANAPRIAQFLTETELAELRAPKKERSPWAPPVRRAR